MGWYLNRYNIFAENEVSDVVGEEAEQGFLGELSPNLRIIIMVVAAVVLYIIISSLYKVLIHREWHPANAKIVAFSVFFVLLCVVFTVLFAQILLLIAIILIWLLVIIFVILAILKWRR